MVSERMVVRATRPSYHSAASLLLSTLLQIMVECPTQILRGSDELHTTERRVKVRGRALLGCDAWQKWEGEAVRHSEPCRRTGR